MTVTSEQTAREERFADALATARASEHERERNMSAEMASSGSRTKVEYKPSDLWLGGCPAATCAVTETLSLQGALTARRSHSSAATPMLEQFIGTVCGTSKAMSGHPFQATNDVCRECDHCNQRGWHSFREVARTNQPF